MAQTREVPQGAAPTSGGLEPQGAARQTSATASANPYADAIGQTQAVDQSANINTAYIKDGVDKIITGERTNVVFQAAEQGRGADVQKIANNALNAGLGVVNENYRGMHKWFEDDIVRNLFGNIDQVIGKFLTNAIDKWIADTAQYLAQFLRIFVLNPNVAVNGLDGTHDDQISRYIRQGADIMYGIAVDLLLLLFILCIWKNWAEASWRGAGNLMGCIGRLIFTAGLLLAWPTIYAFVVQISNEMIKAICFNNTQELAMLHVALATAIKGGLLASAAGVTYILAPVAGGLLGGVPGLWVGKVFEFASLVVFLLLGGTLIAELVYLLVLKAIQTALLTAQYMFAPIFLVFFALPDTENVATGYVRAFVETSLWTFVWVGLLKVMVIVMYADYNPWGKVLIAVGVLQLMIQVPTFLARCQISPMSDLVSAGLVTGGMLKLMGGIGGMLKGGLDNAVSRMDGRAGLSFQNSKNFATVGLGGAVASQNDLNSLNEASKKGREYQWDNGGANGPVPPSKNTGAAGPGAQGQNMASGLNAKPNAKPNANAVPPTNKPAGQPFNTPGANPAAGPQPAPGATAGGSGAAGGAGGSSSGGGGSGSASGAGAGGASAGAAAGTAGPGAAAGGAASGPPPAKPQTKPTDKPDSKPKDEYSWGNTAAEDWEQKGLKNVPARAIVGRITNVDGVGIKHGQKETSIQGSMKNGVERLNVREGASDAELARATYAAGYTDLATQEAGARDAAVRSAVDAKAWKPKGFKQALMANWLESQGKSWSSTQMAKQNFEQGVFEAAASGSAAYVSGSKGNAYTDYLKGRYGEWDAEQDAFATHIVSNPESSESPWNRNIGPATQALIRAGVPINMGTRGAMQNMTVQGMHPSRQKKAALALLSYTYDTAKEQFGEDTGTPAFALGHGELARALPADQVNEAMAIYETSGSQADVKPSYGGYVSKLSGASGQEMPVAYQALAMAAPHVASTMGRLRANINPASIQTLSDLEANIVAAPNETPTQSFHAVMDAVSTGLAAGEMHGIPMKMVTNANVGRGIIEFMGGDILNTSSPDAHRKMRVISQNLRTVGTPNDVSTYAAIDTVLQNNGPMLAGADQINVARALIDAGCPANVLPGAVSMAITGGFHMQSQPLPINTIVEAAALESSGVAMNSQKVRLVGRLLDGGISRDLMPAALDVAINGGYAQSGAALPIGEIESIAKQYQTGALSDTRYTPAVAAMINAGAYNINNQNVRIVAEASADLGGYKNSNDNYIRAVLKVSEGLVNPNVAPGVLETYVRASAANAGVPNALSLPLTDVLNQMPSFDVSQAPNAIRSMQQSGAFSPYQMQDPVAVNMMIDHASSGSYSLRAVNVVARLMGSDQASSSPGHIEVAKEFLTNGGEMTKLNTIEALNAARSFADMREHNCTDPAVFTPAVMEHMKINPSIVRACTPDLMNGGNSISQATWDRIVQNAIQRGGGVGP